MMFPRYSKTRSRARLIAVFVLLSAGQYSMAQVPATLTADSLFLGNTRITFSSQKAAPQPSIQFLHVHENETTAVEAARKMLNDLQKGSFVTWQSQQDRYVQFTLGGDRFKFDPNRIYTDTGAKATLLGNGPFTPEALICLRTAATTFTTKFVDSMRLVIALHNNTDGGGLSIRSYAKGGDYAREALRVSQNQDWDEDDFFYTTNRAIYRFLAQKGFNIILQDNRKVTDDGSLSVYAGKKGIHYLNVEAQHGHLEEQEKMLAAVQMLILKQYR